MERDPEQQGRFEQIAVKKAMGRAGYPGEAVRLLMRYPPGSRKEISKQFPPAIQRQLIESGVVEP